jgi:ice-binding like protein
MVEQHRRTTTRLRGGRAVALTALALGMMPLLAGSAQAATAVDLGTAETFALLAGSQITNVPTSTISGDIGLCCTGSAVDGGINQPAGALYVDSADEAWQAQRDLDVAYASASQPPTVLASTNLSLAGTSANPLTPGVYSSAGFGSLEILGGLYLDFQGDPNAVFIFRGADLLTAANAAGSVNIVNAGSGASSACNISWQLTDPTQGVTLGANSAFKGTTMSLGASTLETGATVDGRILTRDDKAVNLDQNTITRTACAAPASAAGGGTTTTTTPGTTPPAGAPTPTPVATIPRPTPTQTPLAGTALLRGPRGPVRGPFTVTVTGRSIQSVTFYVDGKRRTTVNAARGRRAFSMRIDPRRQGRGVHRVTARVTFTPGSRTGITTRRVTYRRPPGAATPPRFTG